MTFDKLIIGSFCSIGVGLPLSCWQSGASVRLGIIFSRSFICRKNLHSQAHSMPSKKQVILSLAMTFGSALSNGHAGIKIGHGAVIGSRSLVTKDVGHCCKVAMRQPFVLFKGLTFQKLCLPGAFRPGDHNKMLRPGLCVVHASPQYL